MNLARCNVLMIYPRFSAGSFWNYSITSELLGARYPTIPLGLVTLAAMLPAHWTVRLVNLNTETLDEADLDWADLVMTGGMLFQQADSLRLIRRAHARGKPIAIGGPDATSSPHIYADADFRVLGEAEGIIDEFVVAWEAGERAGDFHAPKYQVDVTKSPIPRFDLLRFEDYLFVGVQFSRGCPFTCEFCDIIELYGRVPRTKTAPQMLAELDALYALGYRGHVDFVDDNLIGNKKAVRAFLPHLKAWQEAHNFPFEFSTEASINIADDAELLELMRACGFFAIFVGIESPDSDTLVAMKKKQNTRRSLNESVHRIYDAGMMVTAGFIIGFDSETGSIARADGRLHRGCCDPGGHGGAAFCAAQYADDSPSDQRAPSLRGARFSPGRQGRSVRARPELPDRTAATGDSGGFLPGAQAHIRARCVL